MSTKTYIIVRFQVEGTHYWPDAPADSAESYLKYPHRHVFYFEAKKLVTHSNRDIEFIRFKHLLEEHVKDMLRGLVTLSCEQIAQNLVDIWELASCRVFEDNENGAEVLRVQD